MKTFSISEMEQYSLLKAHTIRTWERRYGILKSKRTTSNIRYYSLDDLAFLLDLSLLNHFGHKVSALASLDKQIIKQQLYSLPSDTAKKQHQINQLILYMFSYNIEDFELVLNSALFTWGIEPTIEEIILPFLERLELFSFEGHPAGDFHFIVTAIRKKLILGIEQASPREQVAKSVLLFLPRGEHFDLLLLYLNYQLKKAGLNILYLGANVLLRDLQEVMEKRKPHFAVSYVSPHKKDSIHKLSLCFVEDNGITLYIIAMGKFPGNYNLPFARIKFIDYRNVSKELLRLAYLSDRKKIST